MRTYSITEIAEICKLNASTLRYYEQIDLLPKVDRNTSGQRIYTQEHIDRLHAIACFKDTGMSIADIRLFFQYEVNEKERIGDILNLLAVYQAESSNKMKKGLEAYAHLLRKIDFYQAIRESFQNKTKHPKWQDFQNRDYLQQAKDTLL